ncbi:MoxR family ATPase [Thermosipho ferrireducens]|uniref:MoxR family ATPase n=1 Tax=Thermosipho ferrireducens TaxID=2571116 RepID=A0ABX7S6R0_9BACT|nr:MoxR family ATPase [Thermosipho ferrireducens]QTA37583.1 MoxR family ATPase [Thermosipho ferrireducens]
MKIEEFKKIWNDDNYLDIAINEYLKFKDNPQYNEQYKKEILSELNNYLQNKRITIDNVVEIIEKLKNANPSKGSFVYWAQLDSLYKISLSYPEIVMKALNVLYDETVNLVERIKIFESIFKVNKLSFSPGTPLIGYLLASYNYKKYPIFKDKIFKNFLELFNINEKYSDKAEKYYYFYQLCYILKEYFEERKYLENPDVLDIQDFIYCLSADDYYNFTFDVDLKYLQMIAKTIDKFENNDEEFINYVNNLDKSYLKKFHDKYSGSEKVNLIRFKIAEKLLNGEKLDLNILEKIKGEISKKYKKNILLPWDNFKILFPFFYEKYKKRDDRILERLLNILKDYIENNLKITFGLKTHIVNFYGSQPFGTDHCWGAIYPSNMKNHQQAVQLGIAIYPTFIAFGLWRGSKLQKKDKSLKSEEDKEHVIDFSIFNKVIRKYEKVIDKFFEYNKLKEMGPNENGGKEKKEHFIDWNKYLTVSQLYFENQDNLLSQISTALKSGKHIILIGPPGTGKSKLAKEICNSYDVDYKMVTAMSDWSTYDTIGGYKPKEDGTLEFVEGIFLKMLKSKNNDKLYWLIIDEINRADIDKTFGPFLSVLTGDEVELSLKSRSGKNIIIKPESDEEQKIDGDNIYILPKNFRIIGTMNTYDKTSLYELSYAFMRRFAFIYVGVPKVISEELVEKLLNKWSIEDKSINEISLKEALLEIWRTANKYRKIGPAIIKDIANYVSIEGDYVSALILYLLPQFEGISEDNIKKFIEELYNSTIEQFKEKEKRQILENFIYDFFGVIIDENA